MGDMEAIAAIGESAKYVTSGIEHAKKGDFDRAIADFTQSITLSPNFNAYLQRGDMYAAIKGDFDRAIADYTEAIAISDGNPRNARPYRNRASLYAMKKDFDRAIADYTEMIRIEPNNAEAYLSRGSMYVAKNDHDKARSDIQSAERIDPELVKERLG